MPSSASTPLQHHEPDLLELDKATESSANPQDQSTPEREEPQNSLFKMLNIKNLAWFFAVGLAGEGLLRATGVHASTLNPSAAAPAALHAKGIFMDTTTNHLFELYHTDEHMSPDTAYAEYMSAYHTETLNSRDVLTKRSWYDCKHLSNIQTLGCNTGHALGSFVSNTGAAAMGGYVGTLLSEAFTNKRDNKNPRSVCLTRDGKNLCVSWASYDSAGLKGGESNDITNFSVQCAQSNGSSEFKTVMNDGGILFICVSDRSDGCGNSVC